MEKLTWVFANYHVVSDSEAYKLRLTISTKGHLGVLALYLNLAATCNPCFLFEVRKLMIFKNCQYQIIVCTFSIYQDVEKNLGFQSKQLSMQHHPRTINKNS